MGSYEINNREMYEFPYEITRVSETLNQKLLGDFRGERTNFVQVGPKKYFFPGKYERDFHNLYNFHVRPDDVWVVTFPRSGTTWTQEMTWLIVNDLDFKTALEVPLVHRAPFLEFSLFVHDEVKAEFLEENSFSKERMAMVEDFARPGWEVLQEAEGPRVIKTHLPFSLLPPNLLTSGCKIIYVARNPKDVAVSFYHLNRLIRTQGYSGDFPKYWEYFRNNLQPWTPYWEHIKEGWSEKTHENVLFMFYEDMNKNLRNTIEKTANFLGKTLRECEVDLLEDHLKIDNFKMNSSVNYDGQRRLGILVDGEEGFVRKGKSGSWQDMFVGKLDETADKWIEENLQGTDIIFPK